LSNEELYLVLGCFGRRDDDFVSCRGVENRILKLNDALENYDEMMDYFEGVRLFDKPLFDQNAIRHFIYNMQERFDQRFKRLWSEKYYNLLERFVVSHRSCGTYIKLILINTEYDEEPEKEPEKVLVKGNPELATKAPELRVIRGRR
jgi:hypothetical protein